VRRHLEYFDFGDPHFGLQTHSRRADALLACACPGAVKASRTENSASIAQAAAKFGLSTATVSGTAQHNSKPSGASPCARLSAVSNRAPEHQMGEDLVSEFDTAIRLWCSGANIEEAIHSASNDELFEFCEVLALISRHYNSRDAEPKNERFAFTANSALSGGSHPCASADCRTERIQSLMTFAALYADEVYIQQPFEDVALRGPQSLREVDRHNVVAGVYNYLLLRPFFKKGTIRFAQQVSPFCDHHHAAVA
jgi:hypothetical protein